MGGIAFGTATPVTYPQSPFAQSGFSPFALQGPGTSPFASPQLYGQSPQSLQQILQVLQIVPQQLHHLQQLVYVQQQQLQQIQQLVQIIPNQLAQLQQLIQFVPQQLQQSLQPFGQVPGAGGFSLTSPWGGAGTMFGAQPGHVM